MDALKTTTSTWFSEVGPMWPGQAFSLEIEEVLVDRRSEYQHIVVARTKTWGNLLVLDGAVQLTERDEYAYHEGIAHLPLMAHPNPKRVLIIGGGDGGALREVLRHPGVEHVVLCEIDAMVVEESRRHFPTVACAFDDPRATIHIGDGLAFMRAHVAEYDVIITDASDPIGPASTLFEKEYYMLMKAALREGGILCSQGESMWLHLDLIASMLSFCRAIFPTVRYAHASVPSYPSGSMGFVICSLDPQLVLEEPRREAPFKCKYYSSGMHRAAFVLPPFAEDAFSGKQK